MKWLFLALWPAALMAIFQPIGDPKALKGGTFTISFFGYPKSLNYYLADEELTLAIAQLVQETLIELHPDTNEPIPRLASSWRISADKRVYTFHLNPEARFSDGKSVTADDVLFTWTALFDPKNKTAPFQSLFGSFESIRVIDPMTVEFKARQVHFQNLEKLSKLYILSRSIYSSADFNKGFNNTLSGSGPYSPIDVVIDQRVVLQKNPDYWGAKLPQNIGRFNFDKLIFKASRDADVSLEIFKKGDIDYFFFLGAKMWSTQTDGTQFQNNYILKLKGENQAPFGTQGFFWNLRRPLFQDRRVRLALSLLLNRDRLIHEIFYDNYRISTGIVAPDSPYHPKDVTPIAYDPKRAKRLLSEAGWVPGDDGVLTKNGKRFEFEMLIDNRVHERYLTIYQEDLKKMGVLMSIRVQDWATCMKLMEDWQFDGHLVVRTRVVDPYNITDEWGSHEANIKGSANITGYNNPKLDALALKIDQTFEKKKRIPLTQSIVRIIAQDIPYTPTWEAKYFRLGHWNRYSFPGKGYFKFSTWRDSFHYWWLDPAKDLLLRRRAHLLFS